MLPKYFVFISLLVMIAKESVAQTVWGVNSSRTETRNDAGLRGDAGAISGFYEAPNPVNFPTGANNWWHLLDLRHSNTTLNYAMQFAGSFFNQELYFRKVSDLANRPWKKIVMGDYGTLGSTVGNTLELLSVNGSQPGGNNCYLKVLLNRYAAGSDWMSASTRIQAVTDVTNQGYIDFNPQGASNGLGFGINNTESLRISSDGTVGIGTTDTKGYKLAVNGNSIFTRVKVMQYGSWADYVFEPTYKLPSLQEVESYINAYKHLQDVPSTKEVEANGLDLGETQAVLLKKIEELTLYVIQQEKEIKEIRAQLEASKTK